MDVKIELLKQCRGFVNYKIKSKSFKFRDQKLCRRQA